MVGYGEVVESYSGTEGVDPSAVSISKMTHLSKL
jgi:hypothetical protein